jgi:hypothetical protein
VAKVGEADQADRDAFDVGYIRYAAATDTSPSTARPRSRTWSWEPPPDGPAHAQRIPGLWASCGGFAVYRWGPSVNRVNKYTGACNACRGAGRQLRADIARNRAFNRHQSRRVFRAST